MKRFWLSLVSLVLVFTLAMPVWAFDVAGDPRLIPGFETESLVDSTQSVVTVTVQGSGLGLYPGDDRSPRYGYGTFGMQGSGFIVNNYVITAAHVVNPMSVFIRCPDGTWFEGPLVNVTEMMIIVGGSPARVFSINVEQDWAILVFTGPAAWIRNIPTKCADTIFYYLTMFGFIAVDQLDPGDMLIAIVRERDADGNRTSMSELRFGKVIAEKPIVPPGYEDSLPWFSLNDFTMDIWMLPGDSGSPILAFLDGVPVIVGIGRASAEFPSGERYSYATRIDVAKLITDSIF